MSVQTEYSTFVLASGPGSNEIYSTAVSPTVLGDENC